MASQATLQLLPRGTLGDWQAWSVSDGRESRFSIAAAGNAVEAKSARCEIQPQEKDFGNEGNVPTKTSPSPARPDSTTGKGEIAKTVANVR